MAALRWTGSVPNLLVFGKLLQFFVTSLSLLQLLIVVSLMQRRLAKKEFLQIPTLSDISPGL